MNAVINIPQDQDLVEELKNGDMPAFGMIYDRYASSLYRVTYNLLRDKEVCEDLIHDLFVDLWLRRDQHHIKVLKAYLYAAAKNRVLMYMRSGRVMVDMSALEDVQAEGDDVESAVHSKEIGVIVDDAINDLPEKCREIFTLSRIKQLSHKEIANLKGISVKTVENQLTIALKRLRPSLKDFFFFTIIISWLAALQK